MQQGHRGFCKQQLTIWDVMPFTPGILMDIIPGSRAACCHCESDPLIPAGGQKARSAMGVSRSGKPTFVTTPFFFLTLSCGGQAPFLTEFPCCLSFYRCWLQPAMWHFIFPQVTALKGVLGKRNLSLTCPASPSAKQQVLFQALSACGLQVCILRPYFSKVSGKRPFWSYWSCLRDSLIHIQLSCWGFLQALFPWGCGGP